MENWSISEDVTTHAIVRDWKCITEAVSTCFQPMERNIFAAFLSAGMKTGMFSHRHDLHRQTHSYNMTEETVG